MHRQIKAYFTVEAALLFPFVLGVILLVIYLWFFQYNRCLLELDAGALALRGSVCGIKDREALIEWLKKEEQKIDAEKYIAWEQEATRMKLERDLLKVERRGSVTFPFAGISFWSTDNLWDTETVFENHITSPALFVRTCRKITGGK